ncbi:MAG TPA: hypothetical protein VFS00_09285, partial [Polyangiaceae bacterium]|nr:hypothetical protein [Polyangiaceae bacterium]
ETIDLALFPDGLGFLKLPYVIEHTESERRLDLIEAEGLAGDLRELVGASFVDELGAAHAEYGSALGITAALDAPAPTRVADSLREMQGALRSYVLQVLAHAESGDDALEAVRAALRPIDAMRAAIGRRSSRGGAGAPGEAPAEGPDGGDAGGGEGGGNEGGGSSGGGGSEGGGSGGSEGGGGSEGADLGSSPLERRYRYFMRGPWLLACRAQRPVGSRCSGRRRGCARHP